MARVDFAFGAPDRLRMACEVVRKHHAAGRRLLVYSQNTSLLTRFDRLLWSFDPTAFIAHVDAGDELAAVTPVLLTTTPPLPEMHPGQGMPEVWLINLDEAIPSTADRFVRILEIVDTKPNEIESARSRWKTYKQAGHELHAHDISGQTPAH